MDELDLHLPDGRNLHIYDRPVDDPDALVAVWHHGTPNIGPPPTPLFAASDAIGIRWIGYDRPGYGGSKPRPGRDIGSAAGDVAAIADALGVERFAVVGHSGGGAHAMACAALLPDRVLAGVSIASLAPYDAGGLDWFAGMAPSGAAALRAAVRGRVAKVAHEASVAGADPGFVASDWAALGGEWRWFESVVGPALANGPGGLIDDDLAYVAPWGFDPAAMRAPLLLLHGTADRVVPIGHGRWLAAAIGSAELREAADAGHISVLDRASDALRWLRSRAVAAPRRG